MKVKICELGSDKEKKDTATLWDKSHTHSIYLKFSFDELSKLLSREKQEKKD